MDCVSGSSAIRGKIEFGKRKNPWIWTNNFGKSTEEKWISIGKRLVFSHFSSMGLNRQNLVFAKSFTMSLKCPLSTSVLVDDGWDGVGTLMYDPHTIPPSAVCIPIILGCFVSFPLWYPSLLLKYPVHPSTLSAFQPIQTRCFRILLFQRIQSSWHFMAIFGLTAFIHINLNHPPFSRIIQ